MKKLFVILLTLVMILSCTGCSGKKAQSLDGFRNIMEDAGYDVETATNAIDLDNMDAEALGVADDELMIIFIQFDSEKDAKKIYSRVQSNLEDENGKASVSVNLTDFSKHEQTSGGEYYYLARVGSTVLFCMADEDSKGTVQDLVNKLGYN